MENLLTELRKYFNTHTMAEILKDWESTSEYDSVGILCCDFIANINENIPSYRIKTNSPEQSLDNYYGPKELSGFFIIIKNFNNNAKLYS